MAKKSSDIRLCGAFRYQKDGKIWIQYNGKEFDIAVRLSEIGIPKQNIG
jgi:uncharacterized protein YprB with RNaseH-like and TPR domain